MPDSPSTPEIPPILYGTAWKEEATRNCVEQALAAGFRGIDTANQPLHYNEVGVGEALKRVIDAGWITREEVFLQTKFTPPGAQGQRIPYDLRAPVPEQVRQSLASSLEHLGIAHLDSLLLHGPTQPRGLGEADWAIWRTFEELQGEGRVAHIGVSNIAADQLASLCESAGTLPAFVQNRTFLRPEADRDVRAYCAERGIIYQGFSLLAILRKVGEADRFAAIARDHGWTPAQLVFRFCLDSDIMPLTGTTDRRHMDQDLAVLDHALSAGEVKELEQLISGKEGRFP